MSRPAVEVADILRAQGNHFLDRYESSVDFQQLKALRAIQRCRTAALGGHIDACSKCGYQAAISYNSCRNRHCPKCQTQARERWLAARERELLATNYFHVVFTVPHELNVLALDNQRLFYDLLFSASKQTLLEVAADPKHLGAEIGLISILHTWGQNLLLHPHVHCVIPAGGLSPDHSRWVHPRYPFFLPVKVLSRVFRGKFCAGLKRLYRSKQLRCTGPASLLADPKQFHRLLRRLHRQDWVVYAKPAFGRSIAGSALPRQIHASGCDLQSQATGVRWGTRHIPLEGLRSRRQATQDETQRHRVPAPILPACVAERLRPNSPLRISVKPFPRLPTGCLPAAVGHERRRTTVAKC
jgi:hypothetical protein